MADANPTGDGHLVPLALPDEHAAILRRDITTWIEALRVDLEEPSRLADPGRARSEMAACERLLGSLQEGGIRVPDEQARALLQRAADAHDAETGYREVLATHDAMHGLIAALKGGES